MMNSIQWEKLRTKAMMMIMAMIMMLFSVAASDAKADGALAGGGEGSLKEVVQKNLREMLRRELELIWGFLMGKLDEMLPPETRSAVLVISGVPLLLLICCSCCCGRHGKMMKAPGGRGQVIQRSAFAGDPKDYFRGLHGGKNHLL